MINKYLPVCLAAAMLVGNILVAQTAGSTTKPASSKAPAKQGELANPTAKSVKPVPAVKKTASGTVDVSKIDPVKLNNQMMMVFMERMKAGNFAEAREIADQMIFGHENFRATESKEYKSFHSIMEKELYHLLEGRQGSKKEVVWVEQPISDGFYLLAMLDFQEGKHEDALANMQRAVYWNPVRSAFYCERGYMLLRNNTNPNPLMAQVAYSKALELADNPEDFAGALRGLAFILLERRQPDVALACLLVAREFTPGENDVEEELFFISRNFPTLYAGMDTAGARQILKKNRILDDYAPEHVQVLLRLADKFKDPQDAPRVVSLLHRAREMAPKNQEVNRRIQLLEKK